MASNPIARLSVVLLGGMLLAGCAASQVKSSWVDETYSGGPLERVLVVGISNKEAVRRTFEDTFVAELRAAGVDASASYPRLTEAKNADAEAIRAAARALSMDRVLVTHLAGVEKKEVFNPPVSTPVPHSYYYSYGRYYSTVYHYVHEPGYYATHEFVRLESNLYDVDTQNLIWSAATETIDPENTASAARDLCRLLVRDLKAKGLVE